MASARKDISQLSPFWQLFFVVLILIIVVLIGEFLREPVRRLATRIFGREILTTGQSLLISLILFLLLYLIFDKILGLHAEKVLEGSHLLDVSD